MGWLDGPIAGMQPSPYGDGVELLYELMSHCASSPFIYAHDWDVSDLVFYDNRNLLHSATWYDNQHIRLIWRTTMMGKPGSIYAGEAKSRAPQEGVELMRGLGDGNWDGISKNHHKVNGKTRSEIGAIELQMPPPFSRVD
jgi:hypothetical protein